MSGKWDFYFLVTWFPGIYIFENEVRMCRIFADIIIICSNFASENQLQNEMHHEHCNKTDETDETECTLFSDQNS